MHGLYIHIPFCVSKCQYCDFYSLPGRQNLIGDYIGALLKEARKFEGEAFRTLYIGGGTPSLLGADGLRRLMEGLKDVFRLNGLEEASIEANPESAGRDFFNMAHSLGFTRVSIGVQSLDDAELRKAGRAHNAGQALDAIRSAFGSGFKDVSVDIMIGLPGQTSDSLGMTLHKVLDAGVTHISAYCLAVEEGTPFAENPPEDMPSDDQQADLYDMVRKMLRSTGFIHYEISNFALPGRECKHNLNYWRGGEYLGLGPAAASHIKGKRLKNASDLDKYLADPLSISIEAEKLHIESKVGEEAMLRLRLLQEGIDVDEMAERFGGENISALHVKLEALVARGDLVKQGSRYCLSRDRVLTSNSILGEVV